jgi:hypothetical protein
LYGIVRSESETKNDRVVLALLVSGDAIATSGLFVREASTKVLVFKKGKGLSAERSNCLKQCSCIVAPMPTTKRQINGITALALPLAAL